ncbi:hypothetical protein BDF19DRAFT_436918 [Syncephalis fuscata]|nr:hypothetical protein BDF19DRAFT_436918 [Syncephalis fuscata]
MWAIPVARACYSMTILQKAYTISRKNRWVLVIGIILTLLQVVLPSALFNIRIIMDTETYRNGSIHYAPFSVLIWYTMSLPVNIFLSSVFSYAAYKQYRKFGSKIWRRLARDGIESICLVILSNTILNVLLYLVKACDLYMFFCFIDCVICSTVLLESCRRTRHILNGANQPMTEKMLHISQIPSPTWDKITITAFK